MTMKKEKTMHIVPLQVMEEYYDLIDAAPFGERDNASFWYLHGELQERIGFDKGVIINCKELGLLKTCSIPNYGRFEKLCFDGIIPCKVEGIEEPCTGFFWTTNHEKGNWMQRGLVVLNSDKEGYEFAKSKYEKKVGIL